MANSAVLQWGGLELEAIQRRLRPAWLWWSSQLLGILPAGVRSWLQHYSSSLTIYIEDKQCRCLPPKGSAVEFDFESDSALESIKDDLAGWSGRCNSVKLVLPASTVLTTTTILPEAAQQNLKQVLGFEMDRLTPLAEPEVYFDYTVIEKHRSDQQLLIELTVILRQKLDATLSRLHKLGLYPRRLMLKGAGDREQEVNLLPQAVTEDLPAQMLHRLLQGSVILLLLLVLFAPLFYLQAKVEGLNADIETIKSSALASSDYLQQSQKLQQQLQTMLQQRQQSVSVVQVFSELTRLLPMDTWVSRLRLHQQQLTLHGESNNASTLIEIVERSPFFKEAKFDASITRNPRSNKERFVINALLVSGGDDIE